MKPEDDACLPGRGPAHVLFKFCRRNWDTAFLMTVRGVSVGVTAYWDDDKRDEIAYRIAR